MPLRGADGGLAAHSAPRAWSGERGLFAPALLVARPALTGIVPLPFT